MALVDDAAVVGRRRRIVAVEVVHRAQQRTEQLVLDRRVDEHVVGRDARLPGVDELAPRDAPGGDLDVGVGGDDGRALATELERDRREVLRRSGHDDPADGAVAGVEDVVELLGEQRRRLVDAAGDDLHDAARRGTAGSSSAIERGGRRAPPRTA